MPQTITKLAFLGDYKFNVNFDEESIPDLIVDEEKPIGDASGPNPSRLLSAAVGHCLSSSLLYCLGKARIKAKNIETIVRTSVERNEQGYVRVKKMDVQIRVETNEKDRPRLPRCLEIFENYCTVTESVRQGIQINVTTT